MPRGKKGSGRPKQLSRAARCNEATKQLRQQADEARSIAEFIAALANQTLIGFRAAKVRIDSLGVDTDEFESLKEEIESWRDNMPENMQNSDKYNLLDDIANCLDSVCSELNAIEVPTLEMAEKDEDVNVAELAAVIEDVELVDTLNTFAEECEAQADEADNVEFPGMMG